MSINQQKLHFISTTNYLPLKLTKVDQSDSIYLISSNCSIQ